MNKSCADCGLVKPLTEFHPSGRGYRANCKVCRARRDRQDKLRRFYNITPEHYATLLEKQGGVCGICGEEEKLRDKNDVVMSLAVDHDHSCCPGAKTCGNCIRGLLCYRCNIAIGMLNDDERLLRNAITYLRNVNGHRTNRRNLRKAMLSLANRWRTSLTD